MADDVPPERNVMEYLVEFIITIPDDAPPAEIKQRVPGETTRIADLAAQGHVLRVWQPLPVDGRWRALGLYRAASDDEGSRAAVRRLACIVPLGGFSVGASSLTRTSKPPGTHGGRSSHRAGVADGPMQLMLTTEK